MVMITDPVADLLSRIKNGYMAGKIEVSMPHSRFKEDIARVLLQYEFIEDISVKAFDNGSKKTLTIYLRYDENGKPAIDNLKQKSKPGRRIYRAVTGLYSVQGGFGILIVSTPKGVMSSDEASALGIGGELIAEIW